MYKRGLFSARQLEILLQDAGMCLSLPVIEHLIVGQPEAISLKLLAALCDALDATPGDFIAVVHEEQADL